MAFEVVHGDHGFAQRKGERVGIGAAGQKCAAKAGSLGVGDGVDVGVVFAGFVQAGLGERHEAADVVAAGQLGHHAAVFGMHGHLGVQLVTDEAVFGAVECHAGFVAGGFDAENEHDRRLPEKSKAVFYSKSTWLSLWRWLARRKMAVCDRTEGGVHADGRIDIHLR